MADKKKIKIYTLRGLAKHLGLRYTYLRNLTPLLKSGELSEYKGFKFFGFPGKAWFAYEKHLDIEIIDASDDE